MSSNQPIDKLFKAVQRIHKVAIGESKESYMSIPPDRRNDADMLLVDAISELKSLREFKAYVHQRLDEAGVPHDPEPLANAEHGCRIEGRLNVVLGNASFMDRRTTGLYTDLERCLKCGAVEGTPHIERMHNVL